ncbi:MAG: PEP-CTERM sorting domain-containing protein [Pseudomonadota bacterium]
MYDLDGDTVNDLGLSEDCCSPNRTYVSGTSTKWQYAWMNAGQVVDGSLAWVSFTSGYTPTAPMLPGLNYLAISNTSMGNYFGYATIDFQLPTVGTGGYSQTLKSYTYDNSGAGITVGAEVPEPASLGLFGLGLMGLVFNARRKKAIKA